LRMARRQGMAAAMAESNGPLMRPLFARIALAQSSGAPMQEAVTAFLADGRAARRGQALEKVRRLPVTLMFPLGLLILPGFVVLFVGPIVLNSLSGLAGSLP
jgi:pilus assembly protein TadC